MYLPAAGAGAGRTLSAYETERGVRLMVRVLVPIRVPHTGTVEVAVSAPTWFSFALRPVPSAVRPQLPEDEASKKPCPTQEVWSR